MRRALLPRVRRAIEIATAFVYMGATEALAYPIGLIVSAFTWIIGPLMAFFVGELVPSQQAVAGNYFTFAVIGVLGTTATSGGTSAFGAQLDVAASSGRLENLLVEPIRWRSLPFGFAGWQILLFSMTLLFQGAFALALGADVRVSAIPIALLIFFGGMASGHAIGILAASVKVLSKRSDPILNIYVIATGLLSGTAFPVSVLPAPLRVLSYLLPQTYVLAAARKVLMPDGASLSGPTAWQALALLAGFLIVMYPLGLWLFGRALEYARRIGTLAGY